MVPRVYAVMEPVRNPLRAKPLLRAPVPDLLAAVCNAKTITNGEMLGKLSPSADTALRTDVCLAHTHTRADTSYGLDYMMCKECCQGTRCGSSIVRSGTHS